MKRSILLLQISAFLLIACDMEEVPPVPYMPPACCGDHPAGITDLGGASGINLEIPEVFTPNWDGINDVLLVLSNATFSSFELTVQRQDSTVMGTTMFQTNDLDNYWIGIKNRGIKDSGTNSEVLPADNYLVLVSGTLDTGESFSDSLRVCMAISCDDNLDSKSCTFPDQLGMGIPLPITNESICD